MFFAGQVSGREKICAGLALPPAWPSTTRPAWAPDDAQLAAGADKMQGVGQGQSAAVLVGRPGELAPSLVCRAVR